MIKRGIPLILTTTLLAIFLHVSSAQAQATRTWVSGVGDDANPCSRTAPCKTFAGAISKTATGGEINCIDPGGFGAVTIVKSMTIDCTNTEAGIVVAGTNGVIVSAAAGDVVVLRGLDIIGTIAVPGLNGILFNTGATLIVEKCSIREFAAGSPNGFGILFKPSASSRLIISNTTISSNGVGSTGGAISIKPSGASPSRVTISHVNAYANINGITVDGTGSTDRTFVDINNTIIASSSLNGISNTSAGGPTNLLIDSSSIVHNTTGITSTGNKSAIFLRNSSVMGNDTGIQFGSAGQVISYQNNLINSNNVDGVPSSVHTPQD
jgi:hypothetical protein